MKQQSWKPYLFFILLSEAVGGLAGWLTREGTKLYQTGIIQPPLSPPGLIFPIVWSILYALMGISTARIWSAPPSINRTRGLRLFATQLIFNFFWSILFFNLESFGIALIWLIALWLLIFWMYLFYRETDQLAAALQIPYLLWVAFAAYLNLGVWILNR